VHAFLELVERDAVALWWYNRARRPAIDLDSFHDLFFQQIRAHYHRRGRTLEVMDLTTDLGIAVAVALSWDEGGGHILMGFGADLEARLAVSRALTELQQLATLNERQLAQAALVSPAHTQQGWRQWWADATVDNQPYIRPVWEVARTAADLPNLYSHDVLEDLHTCLGIVRTAGLELLVLETTRPGVDFATVRVTVPGLRHYYPRFAPGRLYDVPVQMGWVAERLEETALNPLPLFL
jgi:ribosomal protein S12 methylthiotransferase accessory factor